MHHENHKDLIVWCAISQVWSEVGIEEADYLKIATELKKEFDSWQCIQKIIYDVIGSFAFNHGIIVLTCMIVIALSIFFNTFNILLVFSLIVPCIFIMFSIEWGYSEVYLTEKIHIWSAKHKVFKFLNPIRILGYPSIVLLNISHIRRLKKHYLQAY